MLTVFHKIDNWGFLSALCVLLVVLSTIQVAACPKDKPFKKLSRPEKQWVVFHPFKAKKVYRCAVRARFVADSLEKDGSLTDINGGQLDAFRHAYWMALMIESGLKEKTVRRIGENHERGNYSDFKRGKREDSIRADSMSCVMDMRNNEMGISIGKEFVNSDQSISLIRMILIQIWNGKLFILRKDAEGLYLDCYGNVVDISCYKGKWNIPKCIVASDQIVAEH